MGVGSEVCGAIMNGRKGIGVELKPSYYRQAKANVAAVLANGWNEATDQATTPELIAQYRDWEPGQVCADDCGSGAGLEGLLRVEKVGN